MYYKIMNKKFVKIGKTWRVINKLQEWAYASNEIMFWNAMQSIYNFRNNDGYANVKLTFSGKMATITYKNDDIHYKEQYIFVEK